MGTELRSRPRRNVNSAAWIDSGNEARLQRCTLVDISDRGARLAVDDIEDVPGHFSLLLSRFGRPRHQCTVVWKIDDQVGVEFIASALE